jgi:hypothetical protein
MLAMFHVERSCFLFGMYPSTIDFDFRIVPIRRISEDSAHGISDTAFHVERADRTLEV